ncbi:MAG TPA: efflux RND transporter periplasmic adaptor subunit [Prolixibacteraceae bacterium]|nr:efflux RND transporter periplasmic adaptor subunit [Prolixibacteraceae bacterium]
MKNISTILAISALLIVTSCRNEQTTQTSDVSVPVRLTDVVRKPIINTLAVTGTVKPVGSMEITTEAQGNYFLGKNPRTGAPYKMGDQVKKGETIITLENAEYLLSTRIDSKKLSLDISKQEYDKQKSLYDKGGVTLRELKDAEVSYLNAQLDYENATIQNGKLLIRAPFDGVIVALPYYTNGVKLASGTVVMKEMNYSSLLLNAEFPEKYIATVSLGLEAFVTNYNLKGDTLMAEVMELSPAIDEATRTFAGVLNVKNPDLKMRPGMFVKAEIVVEKRDSAIVIERDIVQNRRGGKVVFVVERNTAVEKKIITGIETDKEVEVLSGLEAGEKLVTDGYEMLSNRTKVKVQK